MEINGKHFFRIIVDAILMFITIQFVVSQAECEAFGKQIKIAGMRPACRRNMVADDVNSSRSSSSSSLSFASSILYGGSKSKRMLELLENKLLDMASNMTGTRV